MRRKVAAVWIALIIMVSSIVILVEIADIVDAQTIIYVDDDNVAGPWDGTPSNPYQNIQDGVNAASYGDNVFVYNGTYIENVLINKAINLTGSSRENTTIDGGGSGDVVLINVDYVNISGFKIMNSGLTGWPDLDVGIELDNVEYCRIANNNVSSNNIYGIFLRESSHNTIIGTNVSSNKDHGIFLRLASSHNIVMGNNISYNEGSGIEVFSDIEYVNIIKKDLSPIFLSEVREFVKKIFDFMFVLNYFNLWRYLSR